MQRLLWLETQDWVDHHLLVQLGNVESGVLSTELGPPLYSTLTLAGRIDTFGESRASVAPVWPADCTSRDSLAPVSGEAR